MVVEPRRIYGLKKQLLEENRLFILAPKVLDFFLPKPQILHPKFEAKSCEIYELLLMGLFSLRSFSAILWAAWQTPGTADL